MLDNAAVDKFCYLTFIALNKGLEQTYQQRAKIVQNQEKKKCPFKGQTYSMKFQDSVLTDFKNATPTSFYIFENTTVWKLPMLR